MVSRSRCWGFVLVVVLVGVISGSLMGVTTASADDGSVVADCAAEMPDDFAPPSGDTSEVIGWVEGYWYDQPLNITVDDGLTQEELERLSARTAARFEAMRCLTLEDPSVIEYVEILSREEFSAEQLTEFEEVGESTRIMDNAMFETMLTIDRQTDSVDIRFQDATDRVAGFYDLIDERIVVISDDTDTLMIDEAILAHELGHAIQDQHFDLIQYDRRTVDRDKGVLGLIEGDVHLVEHEYLGACDREEWIEPCLTEDLGPGTGEDPANWGLYFMEFQPYSDGPSFVDGIRADGGWSAVDERYEDPPTSAHHTIYPDSYTAFDPERLDVPDRSTDGWDRVIIEDPPLADDPVTHQTVGMSGIAGMFAAPALETFGQQEIIPSTAMFNYDVTGVDLFNPHDYDHPETLGWVGDELYTYQHADGSVGTHWELRWTSETDAVPFVEAYEALIDIRGGEPVDGHSSTYEFDAETGYDMAVTVVHDGPKVSIVTAPTVGKLSEIDQELAPDTNATNGANDDTDDGVDDDGETNGIDDGSTDGQTDGDVDTDGSGFGFVVVLTGLVASCIVVWRVK